MEKINLMQIREEDANDLIRVLTDNKVKQTYMLPDFSSPEQAYKLFLRLKSLSEDKVHFVRGIYADDLLVGFVNDVQIEGDSVELGWALHPDYHNRGYCTAAVKLAIAQLFELGFAKITAGAFEENPASMRVMEKCGMERIAFTEFIEYRGKNHLCIYYSINKT